MGKTGKISIIPKDFNGSFPTMETSLRQRGYSRMPGTGKTILPALSRSGVYITGLDENAGYILDLIKSNPEAGKRKQEEVRKLKAELEKRLKIDLSADSEYWNFASSAKNKVEPYKLRDGDNLFNLDLDRNPWDYLRYMWISNHPTIASSLQAYERGDYPAETQFYVNDDDYADELQYRKNRATDEAIIKFDACSLEQRKKIVRCMGIPITEDIKESTVYNEFRNAISKPEMQVGPYKGQSPLVIFKTFVDMKKDDLLIRDLVEQAIGNQIYRIGKAQKIYEGEYEAFQSKEEMIDFFSNEKNQNDFLLLQKKLDAKKIQ